ncbi:hypothetical protein P691DRAFT_673435 [Macrolepiota fuliginosa MF-IS2]|uniref:Uncharacterized protein n=1 Tax=Macrolepiota fuliginosa MF-IS2 TaxID=1400762 RepID=A0A9P5XBE0_9AGAR|nr:hypothetical protein P691DRAFT_673435 [Macrolepiota fuliginosa MF-IS2]
MPFPQKKVKRNTCGLRNQSTPFQDTNELEGDGLEHECIFLPKFHCELNPIEILR